VLCGFTQESVTSLKTECWDQFYQHFMSKFLVKKCSVQLFSTYLQFGFVILNFRRKNISAKDARKILVILTTILVNFTNILWTAFAMKMPNFSLAQRFWCRYTKYNKQCSHNLVLPNMCSEIAVQMLFTITLIQCSFEN